jgi:DNA-binding winged helix-turn-helix (wHTH) protein
VKVTFDGIVFDSDTRIVTRDGASLHLSPKAFDLLEMLVRARPRVVRKGEIVDTLWPDVLVEEANLRNLVAEIRAAIGDDAARAIVTLPRVGYAFRPGENGDAPKARYALMIAGSEYAIAEGVTIIGRADDCGIPMRVSGISRHHLRITVDACAATVEDLGSKNGTWLNGRRLAGPTELLNGDELLAGCTTIQFRALQSDEPTTTLSSIVPLSSAK